MNIEFDGIAFPSAEARAYFINMDKAARQKWRDEHAPMKPPLPTEIIKAAPHIGSPPTQLEQPAPQAEEPKTDIDAALAFLDGFFGGEQRDLVAIHKQKNGMPEITADTFAVTDIAGQHLAGNEVVLS